MGTRISRWSIPTRWLLAATLLLLGSSAGAQDCTPGLAFECDTNRGGSDYAVYDMPQPVPQMCSDQCTADNSCRAWTYVRPGVQGPTARCYLKNPAPPASPNNCCVSGVVGRIIDQQVHFEVNTNRGGSDYLRFELPVANPDQCFQQCRGDTRCAAWTFVRPGVQGPLAVCYLKNPAPPPTPHDCCVSGVIPGVVGPPGPPVTPPVVPPPPQAGNCWLTAPTLLEEHAGGPSDWRGIYTRRGTSHDFDVFYSRPGETKNVTATVDPVGTNALNVQRSDYPLLVPLIVGPGIAEGSYQAGTRFTLRCGG